MPRRNPHDDEEEDDVEDFEAGEEEEDEEGGENAEAEAEKEHGKEGGEHGGGSESDSSEEDPEGAFIHPDDLDEEIDEDRFEEPVIWPGVYRPWKEAVEIAKDKQFDDMVYDPATGKKYPLFVDSLKLETSDIGLGAALYLNTTNLMLAVMIFVASLATPAVAFNLYSQYKYKVFSPKEDSFAALTLGAQQAAFVDENGNISSDITYFGYSKDSALLVSSMLDVAYMAFFLAACFMIKAAQLSRVHKRRHGEISIGKYSVMVTGVPKSEAATQELAQEVKEHFESIAGEGSVHEVSITTQNGLLLTLLEHKAHCVDRRRTAASRINRTRGAWGGYAYDYYASRVALDDDQIARIMNNREPKPSVVFVTFTTVAAKEQLLLEYLNPLKFFFWQPAELRFRGRNRLWVKAAPEPDDLYWSHLPFPAVLRYVRQASTHLISIVWIMLTAIIITVSDVQSEKRPPTVDIETTIAAGTLYCDRSFNLAPDIWGQNSTRDLEGRAFLNTYFFNDTEFVAAECRDFVGNGIFLGYKVPGGDEEFAPISTDPLDVINNLTARDISYQCAAFACYGQYCEAKGISSWYYNTEYVSDFCSLYWITWLRSGSILVAATGVSKIVEESIEYVAQSLALWEKHWTQQATEHSTAVKCFSASLFNMLLILIIVYGRIQGVPASGLLNMPFFFGGKYTDFSREWFAEVGSAFIRMMVSQTVLPYFIDHFRMGIRYIWMRIRVRAQVNQHDMDELFSPPDFDLPPRYGEYHATLFVAFTLSSGIPFLMHLLCAFLLIGFISDRVALLRIAERPEPTDESLSILSLDIVPYAAVLHFAFGVWMYGAASTRYIQGGPGYDLAHPKDVSELVKGADMTFADQFNPRKRIFKMAALPQFVGFVVTCSVLLFRVLARPAARYVKSFQDKKKRQMWEEVTELPPVNVVMPQYMHRKKKVRPGSHNDLAGKPSSAEEGNMGGPSVFVKNVVFAADGRAIQWKGALNYDMTTDHRHSESFARMSAGGKLSDDEARLFTVFDHGRRGRRPPKPRDSRMTRKETLRQAQREEDESFDHMEEVAEGDEEEGGYDSYSDHDHEEEVKRKKGKGPREESFKPGSRPGKQPGGADNSRSRGGDEEDPYEPPKTASQI